MKPTNKRKMVETKEEKNDQAPTFTYGEDDSIEGGEFEANSEQPVLSPTVEQGALAPIGAEERESERENEMSLSVE